MVGDLLRGRSDSVLEEEVGQAGANATRESQAPVCVRLEKDRPEVARMLEPPAFCRINLPVNFDVSAAR